jgi:hypothetical protein
MTPIAIRLFENAKYGTTYGAGLRRGAVYNATRRSPNPMPSIYWTLSLVLPG